MNWNLLESPDQLDLIDKESEHHPVLILKHSTRCSISTMALARLERSWQEADAGQLKPYYLDLLRYRSVSNEIAGRYHVQHESPQVLIIKNGRCSYSASHSEIVYSVLLSQV